MNQFEELLTPLEAATILGSPVSEIEAMIDDGKLRTVSRNGRLYLRSTELRRFAHGQREPGISFSRKSARAMAAATAAAIIAGALAPNMSLGPFDKAVHWLAFLVLSTLVVLSFLRWRAVLAAVVLTFAFGVVLEYLQNFVSGRNFTLGDLAANYFGVLSGTIVGFYLKRGADTR